MSTSPLASLLSLYPPPFLHIHDPQNNFKYTDSLSSLHQSRRAFISIDSTECISQRVLFSRVINGLAKWTVEWEENCESWGGPVLGSWDSGFDAFAHALRELWREILKVKDNGDQERAETPQERPDSIVILFENCERLKDFVPTLFVPLTRLAELTRTPVSVVFVSQSTWHTLRPPLGASPTPSLFTVPPLTSTQITTYLSSLFPSSSTQKYPTIHPYNPRLFPLYESYIQALYSACSLVTNSPDQLAYIAAARWPGFVAPLLNDWIVIASTLPSFSDLEENQDIRNVTDDPELFPAPSQDDTFRLLHTFKPTFLPALTALLPRLSSAHEWAEMNSPPGTARLSEPLSLAFSHNSASNSTSSSANTAAELEARLRTFPTRTKILLLASYIASFNPAKSDARLFERSVEGIAKRAKRKSRRGIKKMHGKTLKAAKLSRALVGPASFPLDRLLAIYEALLIEHVGEEFQDDHDVDNPAADLESRTRQSGNPDSPKKAKGNSANDEWGKEIGRVWVGSTISTLVQTHLLQRSSGGSSFLSSAAAGTSLADFEGTTQFRSNVSSEMAGRIAKALKIDLSDVLWDADR